MALFLLTRRWRTQVNGPFSGVPMGQKAWTKTILVRADSAQEAKLFLAQRRREVQWLDAHVHEVVVDGQPGIILHGPTRDVTAQEVERLGAARPKKPGFFKKIRQWVNNRKGEAHG